MERLKNKPKQLLTLKLLIWIVCRCIPSKYSAIVADVLTIIATFTDYPELKGLFIRNKLHNYTPTGYPTTTSKLSIQGREIIVSSLQSPVS